MCEDLDDFKDALDSNQTFVHKSTSTALDLTNGKKQPSDALRSVVVTPQSDFEHPSSTAYIILAGESSSSALRRDRLTALRRRMREEFGAKQVVLSCQIPNDCDSVSIASEATSLHSWHRRVLAETNTVVVHPSDSISTRAGPSFPALLSTSHNQPLPSIHHELEVSTWSPTDATSSSVHITSPSTTSPIGPPPSHPPPPLPPLESVRYIRNDLRSPPPLPPRNPSIRLMDSPATNLHPNPPKNTNRGSSSSNDSVLLTTRDVMSWSGRRGHKKTNSLDRGLTLAKSMKAGPFPPPSNKTNSLTRQETDDDGEECARNTAAEGVILQITTKVIGDHSITSGNCELEPIASDSSSVSSPGSDLSRKVVEPKVIEDEPQEDTLDEVSKISQEISIPNGCFLQDRNSISTEATAAEEVKEIAACSSMDPITRDVERRMSMKRESSHAEEAMSEDIRSEQFSSSRSSMDLAKTWARSYGTFASSLFREAFHRMKTVADRYMNSVFSATKGSCHDFVQVTKRPIADCNRWASSLFPCVSISTKADDSSDSEAEQSESGQPSAGHSTTFVRPRKAKKGPFDFEHLRMVQELNNEHTGAVWCVRFSVCGRLMATAGQDNMIRVWVARSHLKYFLQMRERYQQKASDPSGSPGHEFQPAFRDVDSLRPSSSSGANSHIGEFSGEEEEESTNLFASKPYVVFKGHTADILDLSWSKNYFILSSGMDRTVKLWHLWRNECLCCFQHVDFVTSVAFLPKDDRYFLSGSLDGKLRMWHIPDKKVAVWNEVPVKFITAITFVKNGKFAVVGTYNGRCFFYSTDQLKYHTVVDVRSTRGRNAKGHKITGLAVHGDKLLVTSNDSRIRMYDVRDKALTCKFRGAQNEHSQIRAAFSPDGKHIVCGSEDKFIYLWRTADLPSTLSVRKDRNNMWERVRAHSAAVSVAVFAPKPQVFLSMMAKLEDNNRETGCGGHVIVSADLQGCIKIMVNRPKCTKPGHNTFIGQE